MAKVLVNGISYNYQTNLTDPTKKIYVFLHGFLGSKKDFEKLIDGFSEQYLILDLLGFGANRDQEIPKDRFVQANQINDLENIFEQLGLSKIDLVGYSMGGRIAIAYALKYQTRLDHLFLESTTAGIENELERQKRIKHDESLARSVLDQGMTKFIQMWEDQPLFRTQKHVSSQQIQFMHQQRIQQNPVNVANSLIEMGTGHQPNYWPDLSNLKSIPVTIICGQLDQKFVLIGEKLHHHIPNSSRIVIRNVGHNIHFEDPERFKSILLTK